MTERLKRRTHDEIVNRWFTVRTPGNAVYGQPDYDDSHIRGIRHAGDELQSYGPHFPLVNAIRDAKGTVRLWLLNGDRWGGGGGWGVATSTQQTQVRNLAESTGIPTVIIPFSALNAARIIFDSIKPHAIDRDTWTSYTFTTQGFPEDGRRVATHERVEGTGCGTLPNGTYGTERYASIEDIPEHIRAYFTSEGEVKSQYQERTVTRTSFGRRHRAYGINQGPRDYATGAIRLEGAYGEKVGYYVVPTVYRHTGSRVEGAHGTYDYDAETDTYSQSRREHTLGQAVFSAQYLGTEGKRYRADFLSGIDTTPTGSGYFLVQLPKGADTSTVQSAIESLKPETVHAAESMGLDVKRQGDLFAIPTEFSLRQLRTMGAEVRQSKLASEERRAAIREEWETAYADKLREFGIPTERWANFTEAQSAQREEIRADYSRKAREAVREFDATHAVHVKRELYGTRHYGTDVAILPSGVMLARGTLRHSGGQHSMLKLGKVWHIVVRNTVPLSR